MKPDLKALEAAMQKKYGFNFDQYTTDLFALQDILEKHPDWFMKRMGGHRWEVRNGKKDKAYYGPTLAVALCEALVDL